MEKENKFIKVKVHPESKEQKITKENDRFIVKIKEKPEDGRANEKVKDMLSEFFQNKRLQLIKGSKSRNKIFKLHNNETK